MNIIKLYAIPLIPEPDLMDMDVQGEYEIGIDDSVKSDQLILSALSLFYHSVPIKKRDDFKITLFSQGIEMFETYKAYEDVDPSLGYVDRVTHGLPAYMNSPVTLYEYANETKCLLEKLIPFLLGETHDHKYKMPFDQAHRLLLKTKRLLNKAHGSPGLNSPAKASQNAPHDGLQKINN